MRTLKLAAPISLLVVATLYVLTNVAFFAAIPKAEIVKSNQLTAALFFEAVFGPGAKGLPALIAVSAAGNILAIIIGSSRQIRECARQGVVPWSHIWVSTRPFGTPIGPIFLKWAATMIVIVALPFGDAFNFVVDLRSYPDCKCFSFLFFSFFFKYLGKMQANSSLAIFLFLTVVGIYVTRHRRKKQNLPPPEFQVWHIATMFAMLICVFLLVMPWYPPKNGGDVSFWYATYCVVGIGLILACGACYTLWIWVLPKARGYQIRAETLVLHGDGSVTHCLRKVPNNQIEEWDRTHDSAGNLLEGDGFESEGDQANNLVKRVKVKGIDDTDS